MSDDSLDLTPSPRILDVIADVDITVEQCLAELIDNALDEIAGAQREDPGFEGRVDITLPTGSAVTENSTIVVADTGRGMSLDQMQEALRAGASGNDRFGALGLFGMGFNVATGRLGFSTTVKSGKAGDDFWTIATIDIQAMGADDTFRVPIDRESKNLGEHGTSISVSQLRADIVKRLTWNGIAGRVKKVLGETYSYMLREVVGTDIAGAEVFGGLGLKLHLNNELIRPYIPCIWSPERSVPYKGTSVPAVVEINEQLGVAMACLVCGHWHSPEVMDIESCVECRSTRIEPRAREIRGWLGIQRYDDAQDFGISLLRQGRTISHLDKGLFWWTNPDSGEQLLEYPAELRTGRIVGELHLDHLPVSYRKTDFGRDSVAWRTVVGKVRGVGPLKPDKAKQAGFDTNTSPLGPLFSAYRRYDAGKRYLVPGDGQRALTEQARKWAKKFREGYSDYQSDEIWWQKVLEHEDIAAGLADPGDDDDTDIGELLPGDSDDRGAVPYDPEDDGGDSTQSEAPAPDKTVSETRDERLGRFRSHGRVLPQLDKTLIRIPDTPTTINIKVTAYLTRGVDLPDNHSYANLDAGALEMFIDERHPLLSRYGWHPVDVAVAHMHDNAAAYLKYSGGAGTFVGQVLQQLGDRQLDSVTVRLSAESLLERLREAAVEIVKENPKGVMSALSHQAKAEIQKTAADQGIDSDWTELVDSGGFIAYLSPRAFEDLVLEKPQEMLDGGVFTTTYVTWSDEAIREERVAHVTSLLRDLRRTMNAHGKLGARELLRLSIGLESLAALIKGGAS
jgi:hypothetical protein